MRFEKECLLRALDPLNGLRVAQIYHAANMRGLRFRPAIAHDPERGEWFLHISCTWRLDREGAIVTGSHDWFEHAQQRDLLSDEWEPAEGGSLQEGILRSLLADIPGEDRTIWNRTGLLVVEAVNADTCGGFSLAFNAGYRLAAFPSGTRSEYWRLFPGSPDSVHFVVGCED